MKDQTKSKSASTAFEKGDFTEAYHLAKSNELKGAALVMLGLFERGLTKIGEATDDRSQFCAAIGNWGMGQPGKSIELLENLNPKSQYNSSAKKLISYIKRDKIRILLQAREEPNYINYNTVKAVRDISNADVITIGYMSDADIVINAKTTLEEVLHSLPEGWIPDFFLCNMIEDHPPPIGIENASFLTFYSTQDFDRHYHHCRSLLGLFDGALAFGSVFHEELEKHTGNAFVCPLLMGIDDTGFIQKKRTKNNDIYVSGNLFKHSKGKLNYIWQLSQLPKKYKILFEDKYLSQRRYYERMSEAKLTFTFVQNWGITNSRGFEAVALGSKALYQENSELGIFLEETNSLIPYSKNSFTETAINALENLIEDKKSRTNNDPETTQRVFNYGQMTHRLFLLLSVYASLITKVNRKDPEENSNIRYINRSPQRIMYCYDNDAEKYLESQKLFRSGLYENETYIALDAIGESYLYSHLMKKSLAQAMINHRIKMAQAAGPLARKQIEFLESYKEHHQSRELSLSKQNFQKLAKQFPDRIASHFNLSRLNYEIGLSKEALIGFEYILATPSLTYKPSDLLFWREFQDTYYDYEDLMFSLRDFDRTNDKKYLQKIEQGIRESALYYATEITLRNGDLEKSNNKMEKYFSSHSTLPALWFIRFKLAIRSSDTKLAKSIIDEIFTSRPWMLIIFGKEIVKISETSGLKIDNIKKCVDLFQSRLNQ